MLAGIRPIKTERIQVDIPSHTPNETPTWIPLAGFNVDSFFDVTILNEMQTCPQLALRGSIT